MHLENSLAIYNSERDRDFAFRFGQDSGVSAMIVLALTLWPLGEIKRASQYAEEAITQAAMSPMSRRKLLLTATSRFLR